MQLDLQQRKEKLEGEKGKGKIQAFHLVPLPSPSRLSFIHFNIKIKLSCPRSVYILWRTYPLSLSLESKLFGKGPLENLRIKHSGMRCTFSKRCFCCKPRTLLSLWQVEGNF